MDGEPNCAACGVDGLRALWSVAGDAGREGLVPTTDRFGTALADIVRCPRCGHMQTEPMPADAELEGAYAEAESDAYLVETDGQRATARRELARIERHTGGPGALLDLGCWVGHLLVEAERSGWRVTGVEPSGFASAYARDRLGLDVRTGPLLEVPLPEGAYDAIAMGDVLEHLPDPAAALARVRTLLAPGGVLWLALPDAGSRVARMLGARWWSVIPTHVQYFTRGSLTTLLARCGFEVVEIDTSPKAFTVRYYLERTGGYSPALARLLVTGALRIGVAERIWAPDFRDRIAVVARVARPA